MITTLAGGVGGARLAAGLASVLPAGDLNVIVNTADDFEHLGLAISPDLDTVMYTLAGIENAEQGWGIAEETWAFMGALERLGGETWFRLGDRDMATHIERTRRLAAGAKLSQVTQELCCAMGVTSHVIPMSDQPVRTLVETEGGTLDFQDYFVRGRCEPRVLSVAFAGSAEARATAAALAALSSPELEALVLAPSNPFVSIAPILAVEGLVHAIDARRVPLVAVSPIVGGNAIKGPAAKMLAELGAEVSAVGIARHYRGLIDGLVIDHVDGHLAADIAALDMAVHVCDTIMRDGHARRRLAEETLAFARTLRRHERWQRAAPRA